MLDKYLILKNGTITTLVATLFNLGVLLTVVAGLLPLNNKLPPITI
jgi:hypothetical protein